MGDVAEYERRIAYALSRIGQGLVRAQAQVLAAGQQPDPSPAQTPAAPTDAPTEDVAALRLALDEERMVSAQLEQRLKSLREKHEARETAIATERKAMQARLTDMDTALQRLRETQAELGGIVAELRSAASADLTGAEAPGADLINRAMQAEIDGLRALRAADAAEVDAVLAELRPLLEEER